MLVARCEVCPMGSLAKKTIGAVVSNSRLLHCPSWHALHEGLTSSMKSISGFGTPHSMGFTVPCAVTGLVCDKTTRMIHRTSCALQNPQ